METEHKVATKEGLSRSRLSLESSSEQVTVTEVHRHMTAKTIVMTDLLLKNKLNASKFVKRIRVPSWSSVAGAVSSVFAGGATTLSFEGKREYLAGHLLGAHVQAVGAMFFLGGLFVVALKLTKKWEARYRPHLSQDGPEGLYNEILDGAEVEKKLEVLQ